MHDDQEAQPRRATWLRDELLHLLWLSGTLGGLCITGVALFHAIGLYFGTAAPSERNNR